MITISKLKRYSRKIDYFTIQNLSDNYVILQMLTFRNNMFHTKRQLSVTDTYHKKQESGISNKLLNI